ncbi:unnamed protein product [Auanema sp. JU1783]|nr:unnamed protein product [Auanema sp. JU1783]
MIIRLLLLSTLLYGACDSYKILIYNPIFGHSHVKFLSTLADILTDAGHQVTVFAPVANAELENKHCLKTTKDLRTMKQTPKLKEYHVKIEEKMGKQLWTIGTDPRALFAVADDMKKMFAELCRGVLDNVDMIEGLRKEKYDIALAEPFSFCGFGIFEKLGIPVTLAALSNVQMDYVSRYIGEPLGVSFVPGSLSPFLPNMTFFQRAENFIGTYFGIDYFTSSLALEHKHFLKENKSFRSVEDIIGDVSYVFPNSDPYLNFERPIAHKTIEVGGITMNGVDDNIPKVDEKWSKILDERKYTVFVSFGSVALSKQMPDNYKKTLLSVFEELKDVTFIWKYEEDTDMADHLPNVYLGKWLPQVALLHDPRLDLFVTHGGLGSCVEVAYAGKPALYIPLFADQTRNTMMVNRYGVGGSLLKTDLSDKKKIVDKLRTLITDKTYRENALKLGEILRSNPINKKETFLKHVEFAGRVGRIPNLESYARHLSFVEFYFLDVIGVALLILLSAVVLTYLIIRKLLNLVFSSKAKKD